MTNPDTVRNRLSGIAIVVSSLALAASACSAWNSSRSASVSGAQLELAVKKSSEEAEKESLRKWQKTILFAVIEEGTKNKSPGMTLDEIRTKYLVEASAVKEPDIPKSELTPLALRRLLLDLLSGGLIYQTFEDKYVIQRTAVNMQADRYYILTAAQSYTLSLLCIEGGKYSLADLRQLICDKYDISSEEFNVLFAQLDASRAVVTGDDMRLWASINAPTRMLDKRDP